MINSHKLIDVSVFSYLFLEQVIDIVKDIARAKVINP